MSAILRLLKVASLDLSQMAQTTSGLQPSSDRGEFDSYFGDCSSKLWIPLPACTCAVFSLLLDG